MLFDMLAGTPKVEREMNLKTPNEAVDNRKILLASGWIQVIHVQSLLGRYKVEKGGQQEL